MNSVLLQRFKSGIQTPKAISFFGNGGYRPSSSLIDAVKKVAIISIFTAASVGGLAHAKGVAKPDEKAFNTAYAMTLGNEGGYRITVDMPVLKGKKVVGYERIFNSATDETEITHGENETVLRNIKTNQSVSLQSADMNAKIPVITHAGIDSRHSTVDVLHLTADQIKKVYHDNYWPSNLLKAGLDIAKISFDIGVNRGVATRNDMLAKVVFDLSSYEINTDAGLSSADIAVIAGIAKKHPGAIEYGLSEEARAQYESLVTQAKHKQNKNGWLNRAGSYAEIAGEVGKTNYELLLSNANTGREALASEQGALGDPIDSLIIVPVATQITDAKPQELAVDPAKVVIEPISFGVAEQRM